MYYEKIFSEVKHILKIQKIKIVKRLDRNEEKLQLRSENQKRLESLDKSWDVLTKQMCDMFEQLAYKEKREEDVKNFEVAKEDEKLVEKENLATPSEESLVININISNLRYTHFEVNKKPENKLILSHTKKLKMSTSIAEIKSMQDLRTNLLQERENDMIIGATKQRYFKDSMPNLVQYFNEEFHGLGEDEWKKYKELVYSAFTHIKFTCLESKCQSECYYESRKREEEDLITSGHDSQVSILLSALFNGVKWAEL